jgi:hypothetical protein
MNKAEALTQIECIVVGTKSLNIKQHEQIGKVLDEYAQQVSRETAVNFELRHLLKTDAARRITYGYFDKWIKNQQQ